VPQNQNPSLTASSYEEAKALADEFRQLSESAAWLKLRKFITFMVLKEGRMALLEPDSAKSRGDFVRGVQYMLNIVDGIFDEIDVVESEEGDEDADLLALSDVGGSDPL